MTHTELLQALLVERHQGMPRWNLQPCETPTYSPAEIAEHQTILAAEYKGYDDLRAVAA